jgi:hypothetical protein
MDYMTGEGDEGSKTTYRQDDIGTATRLTDVLRSTMRTNEIMASSDEVKLIVQQLCEFQQEALCSPEHLLATIVREQGTRTMDGTYEGADVPDQAKIKSIKSQQASASRERERMIQGIQGEAGASADSHNAAVYRVMSGFGEDDISITSADPETIIQTGGPSTRIRFRPSTSFSQAGKDVAEMFTLNQRQNIAFQLLCRHLDRVERGERAIPQLCQFVGGEGGTGKSRVIEALIALFASKGIRHRLLVTATSGTAAASINGITIHSACNFSVDTSRTTFTAAASTVLRVDGQSRMDWQEKYMLIIDEISMLGARTLHAVNQQLCVFRGSTEDFGGIPVVLWLGDPHQFRPVQERSVLVPSDDFPWDGGKVFRLEQRYEHDKAHTLWKKFTTVVMLHEQVRAAGDPQLQRLLVRVRQGQADQTDVDLLNSMCFREGRRIPWETGITVITPLNRNRWSLNVEATLSFQKQHQAQLRIFISEHKWKDGQPTEEEALMILSYGDDSSVPVPAIFMFVPGMPVVVNRNSYQGLKLVNGANYNALEVILDKAYPGHRVSADVIVHFGPPAGILLAAETTKDFNFVGMPPGTILLTPLSSKLDCVKRRPWQRHDVTRRGLPCTAAFACTDYKVQGRTLERVALQLRGTRTTNVQGEQVPSQCDPYSLYVQLSRTRSLDGIMLLSKVRTRDIVGNTVPENMVAAEKRLEELSEATIRDAELLN